MAKKGKDKNYPFRNPKTGELGWAFWLMIGVIVAVIVLGIAVGVVVYLRRTGGMDRKDPKEILRADMVADIEADVEADIVASGEDFSRFAGQGQRHGKFSKEALKPLNRDTMSTQGQDKTDLQEVIRSDEGFDDY